MKTLVFTVLTLAMLLCPMLTLGDTINYSITGVPFEAPSADTWTFLLNQNPTPDVVDADDFEFENLMVSMNGTAEIPYFVEFMIEPNGTQELAFQCNPWWACGWDDAAGFGVLGNFFTGSTSDPTLLDTSFTLDPPDGDTTVTATTRVSEPSAVIELLVGIMIIAALAYGRMRSPKNYQF